MKRSYMGFLLAVIIVLAGCASTFLSPTVENNNFISHRSPKLVIQVSDDLPFIDSEKKERSGSDVYGSMSTIRVQKERYIFMDYRGDRGLVIALEKFKGTAGKWEMEAPDYSSWPGIIETGSTRLDDRTYLTGIYVRSEKNGQYLYKSFGRVCGAGNTVRFQIFYSEKLRRSLPDSSGLSSTEQDSVAAFVKEFSARADSSFTILPYSEMQQKTTETSGNVQPVSSQKEKQFVEVLEPDVVFMKGKVKFKINVGDTLEIVTKKTCRGGRGECWIVRHTGSRETGAVSAKRMNTYHRVYSAQRPEITVPPDSNPSQRTYVDVRSPEKIFIKGNMTFIVTEGDTLEVLQRKKCRSSDEECWAVRNIKTGDFGYVKADLIRSKHRVYTEADK